MDDLSGLSWNSSSGVKRPTPRYQGADLHPSPPTSRGSTPFSQPPARSVSPAKPSTAGGDSFANLVAFGSGTNDKNLSLAEKQRQLAEQKAREEREKREQLDAQYGHSNGELWNRLETAGSTRSVTPGQSVNGSQQGGANDEDDILAAFNASAPVDTSTNFPVPSSSSSSRPDPTLAPVQSHTSSSAHVSQTIEDDDDPFGLTDLKPKPAKQQATQQHADDDDILGPLAKPVSEFPRQQQESTSTTLEVGDEPASVGADGSMDKPLADLVDMGFPVEDAREALATTQSGTDVQEAVGWLLNRAHSESQRKPQTRQTRGRQEPSVDNVTRNTREPDAPAWMRGNDRGTADKDPTQLATQFGNNLFKSANSLWKSGTKRMQQAVEDFNAPPPDPTQPRWMRSTVETETTTSQDGNVKVQKETRQANVSSGQPGDLVTDEAMMLEPQSAPVRSNGPSPAPGSHAQRRAQNKDHSSGFQPPQHASSPRDTPHKEMRSSAKNATRSQLTRLGTEEETSQAYVSPARRRRAAPGKPTPESQPEPPEPQSDLLEQSAMPSQQRGKPKPPPQAPPPTRSTPLQVRPKAPARSIAPIQPSSLQTSTQHRQKGSEAFKRGDYSAAHVSYSSALSLVPEKHPIAIVILTNRALTGLKIGDSKSAISDADRAMSIVGPAKGESEKIDLGSGEPIKDMKDFYGKALMRKAEALEHLERWTDAAKVWQEAVESGHGGGTSMQGRNRCEKAAGIRQMSSSKPGPKPSPAAPPKPRSQPAKGPPTAAASAKPAEAVSRLRAANDAADRADGEKFALSDGIEARIAAWRNGKQDNLRALLSSLENVLWPEAQWKKINMSELLLPNKVKIQYMKGISKVHPDKVSEIKSSFFISPPAI